MIKYRGIYASYLMQYINFKRSLGYKFRAEYIYLLFDRFTINEQVVDVGLTKELADKWGQMRPNETSQTRYHRVALVCQFSVFLKGLGITSYIPKLPKKQCTFTPYIFSEAEIKLFFFHATGYKPDVDSLILA